MTPNTQTDLVRFPQAGPPRVAVSGWDLCDPQNVAEVFALAKLQLAEVTRTGWKFLWAQHGLDGLLAINREAGWFDAYDDERAAEALVRQSLVDGYDPVSGLFGNYRGQTATFELTV